MSLVLSGIAIAAAPHAHADSPVTEFSFDSPAGSFVGSGLSETFTPPVATIVISGTLGEMAVDVSTPTERWEAGFEAAPGYQLQPGSYPDVRRARTGDPDHAGLDVYGDGRGCGQVYGSFEIYAISADASGQVNLFDASYVEHCENPSAAPITGTVRFHAPASAPVTLASVAPSTVRFQPVMFTAQVAAPAGGVVTFFDGTTALGTAPVDAQGRAHLTVSSLTIGSHSVTAEYGSDTSAAVTQTVRDNDVSYWFASVSREDIGAGATASYAVPDSSITFTGTLSSAQMSISRGTEWWTVILHPPTGQSLHVGNYLDAQEFATSTQAGLQAFGDGRGCTDIGSINISQIHADGTGALDAFEATFTHQCSNNTQTILLATMHFHGDTTPPPTTTTVSTSTTVAPTTTTTRPTTPTTIHTFPQHPKPVSVGPKALTFGNQRVGTYGDAQLVTVTNPGSVPVTIAAIGIGGADPDDFFGATSCVSHGVGRVLAAHATCQGLVYFGPLQRGKRSATFVVIDNSASPVHTLSLTGTGTEGYFIAGAHGEVGNFGDAVFHGDATKLRLSAPMISLATTPNGAGYWLLGQDGGIFSFGNARFYGSTGNIHLNKPVVAMAASRDGKGYRLVASDGGIFAFGGARFYGSTGNIHLNKPINGMAATYDDRGYWLVASDGGIFAFGDAHFYGSAANAHLSAPVAAMAPTPSGRGYWILTTDGHLYTYGDAHSFGTATGMHTIGIAPTPDGRGYWEVTSTGRVLNFGDAAKYGDVEKLGVDDVIGVAATAPPLPPALLAAARANVVQPSASKIASGESGVRSMLAPTSASASATALKMAGGEPMAPPSPMPLWPPGVGDGVSTWPYSMVGTSVVVGNK